MSSNFESALLFKLVSERTCNQNVLLCSSVVDFVIFVLWVLCEQPFRHVFHLVLWPVDCDLFLQQFLEVFQPCPDQCFVLVSVCFGSNPRLLNIATWFCTCSNLTFLWRLSLCQSTDCFGNASETHFGLHSQITQDCFNVHPVSASYSEHCKKGLLCYTARGYLDVGYSPQQKTSTAVNTG